MPFDAGSVFVRAGMHFDPSGFEKYDRAVEKARRMKEAKAVLGAEFNPAAFEKYDKALLEQRRKTEQASKLKARLGGDFNSRAFNQYNRALTTSEERTGRLGRATTSLGRSLKGAAVAAGATVAAYAGLSEIKKSVEITEELGKATLLLSRNFGLTTKAASEWAVVAKTRDIDPTALHMGFTKLSRTVEAASSEYDKNKMKLDALGNSQADQMKRQVMLAAGAGKNAAAFKSLGITQDDLKRGQHDFTFLLEKVTAGFSNMKGNTERATLAQQLFGRGAKSLLPLLRQGAQGFDAQAKMAEKYGAVLDGKAITTTKQLLVAQREARFATLGLQIAFTEKLEPSLIKSLHWVSAFILGMKTGKGVGGDFARIVGQIAHYFHQVGDFTREAARKIGDFLGQHPELRHLLITMLKIAAAAKAFVFVAKISGLATVVSGVGKLIGLFKTLTTAAETATAAEIAAGRGGGVVGGKGVGGLAKGVGVGAGAGLAAGVAPAASVAAAAAFAAYETKQLAKVKVPDRIKSAAEAGNRAALAYVAAFKKETEGQSKFGLVRVLFRRGEDQKQAQAAGEAAQKAFIRGAAVDANTRALKDNAKASHGAALGVDQFGHAVAQQGAVKTLTSDVSVLRGKLGAMTKGTAEYKDTAEKLRQKQSQLNAVIRLTPDAANKGSRGLRNFKGSAQDTANVTRQATGAIAGAINVLAKAVGIKMIHLNTAALRSGSDKGQGIQQFGPQGLAGGGWLGRPGQVGPDSISTGAPNGSVVYNRHQMPVVDQLARAAGLGGLGAVIEGTRGGGGPLVPFVGAPGELVAYPQAASVLERALAPIGGHAGLFGSISRRHDMASGGSLTRMVGAANRLDHAHFPYVWGGGHSASPAPFGPMDCSGAVSYVLQQGGVPIPTMVSGALAGAGMPGPGTATVFANPTHTFMRIAGRYFGTSGSNPGGGAGWMPDPGSGYRARFTQRHFAAMIARLKRLMITGPASPLHTVAQGGADLMRRWGNRYLSSATPVGAGDPGDAGPGIHGRVSTFGPPLEPAGRTASGVSSSQPGIALRQRDFGRAYRLVIGAHSGVLPHTDWGPAAWTGRAIDVTGAGARTLGIDPRHFPTNAMGTAFPRAQGGPVATGGHRQRSPLQQRSLDMMLKVWAHAKSLYPGQHGFPKTLFIPNSLFVGMAANPSGSRSGREVIWPDWLLRANKADPGNSALKETMIHEWAHYFQKPSVNTGPQWQVEGGAQAFARAHAAQIFSAAGLPYKQGASRYDTYMGYVRRVRGQLGNKWINHDQFVGKNRGGPIGAFARGGGITSPGGRHPWTLGGGFGGFGSHAFSGINAGGLHLRSLRHQKVYEVGQYNALSSHLDDQRKAYDQKDREYGQSEEVLVNPDTGQVDTGMVNQRLAELDDLIQRRRDIETTLIQMQAIAKTVIDSLKTIISRLTKSLRHAAKKNRGGIKDQITAAKAALTEWRGNFKDLGFDIGDARLDVGDIVNERASVAGTSASTDTTSDTGSGSEDVAAQLAQANARTAALAESLRLSESAVLAFGSPGNIGSGGATTAAGEFGFAPGGPGGSGGGGGSGSGGSAGAGGGYEPITPTAGGGPYINIYTLHPGDPETLRAVGDAAAAGFGYQSYVPKSREYSGA